ncbi:MAG: lysylphosphatidylglycerol synthase transmembrane domain-containing protein [Patescibacteria group bacterium]
MAYRGFTLPKKIFSWSNIVFMALCAAVFYFVVHNFTELKNVHVLFSQIDGWWIAAAVAAQVLTYLSTATLYYSVTNNVKEKTSITLPAFFKLAIVIMFINQIVPSGGLGGNGFFYSEMRKRGLAAKKAFFVIIMDCLALYVSLGLLLLILPAWYLSVAKHMPNVFYYVCIFGFLLYGGLAAVITIVSHQETLQYAIAKLSRIKFLAKRLKKARLSDEEIFQDYGTKGPWGIFLKYKTVSWGAVLCQLAVFFADSFTIFALLEGLHVHVSFLVIAFGLLLTFVAAALPISPGALLVYEGAMTFFYASMGMPFQAALIVTLLYRVLSFWIPIVAGLVLYKHVQTDAVEPVL